MPESDVYVVAPVGYSPGVLTELLWSLVVRDKRRIAGCEVWATDEGRRALAADPHRLFRKLHDALTPAERDRLPRWETPFRTCFEPSLVPRSGFQVFVPRDGHEQNLEDVGDERHTRIFSNWAHLRFATLAKRVKNPIVASLAGGRKAMSAILHSAFTLYARPGDRLVHVIVHPQVESALRGRKDAQGRELLPQYACPRKDELFDVPLDAQVSMFEVPFYPVAGFMEGAGPKPAKALVKAMRDTLLALRSIQEGRRAWVTRASPTMATIHLGQGDLVRHRDYVLAWVLLVTTRGPLTAGELLARVEARLQARGVATSRESASAERRFRQLAHDLAAPAGAGAAARSLLPQKERVDGRLTGRWLVNPSAEADLSALDFDAVLAELCPTDTTS